MSPMAWRNAMIGAALFWGSVAFIVWVLFW
jgi:hypothetical protein